MSFQITVTNIGRTIECPENRTILSAALAAGSDYPYGCELKGRELAHGPGRGSRSATWRAQDLQFSNPV